MTAARPLTESVLGRVPPEYDYKRPQHETEQPYEGEIYSPPPLVRMLLGYTRYFMGPRAWYDQGQRKMTVPKEIELAREELTWDESLRNKTTLKAGLPHKQRPFPWKDQYQRTGWCPEMYDRYEYKLPRRTNLHKYIPPPKDGVYEDTYHISQHKDWVNKELAIYRYEWGKVKDTYKMCVWRNPNTHNTTCRLLKEAMFNLQSKTNTEKVKNLLWSGVPAIKDGGFKVRY